MLVFDNDFIKVFFSIGSIENKWLSVQVMAWSHVGDKALPEPMMTQLTDYIHASSGFNVLI